MKTLHIIIITIILSFTFSLSAQFMNVERYNKEFKIEIANPGISIHAPTGIIYQDTTGQGFANLNDHVLRIASRPIGFQFQQYNAVYTEQTQNSFSINHWNGTPGIFLIGPAQRAYWGPRSPGDAFPLYYDIKTVGNIYNVDIANRRMAELRIESNRGGLRLHRYSGGFAYYHTLTINDAGTPVWSAVSDRNAKYDIIDSDEVLPRLSKIQLKKYKYKGSEIETTGFIAQDVQAAFPDLVEENEDGYLSVNYMGLSPLAIQAINEQQEIIESLIERIEKLENKKSN